MKEVALALLRYCLLDKKQENIECCILGWFYYIYILGPISSFLLKFVKNLFSLLYFHSATNHTLIVDRSPPGLYFYWDLSSKVGLNVKRKSSFHQKRIGKAKHRCTYSMPKQTEWGLEYPLEMKKYVLTQGEFHVTRSPVVGKVRSKKDGMKITSHVNYYLWVIMNILDVEYLVSTLVTFTSHKCKCVATTERHAV